MPTWVFFGYKKSNGKCAVREWYFDQSDAVRAALDAALEYLEPRTRDEWRRPEFDGLKGKQKGLGEIRITADKKEYRIIGFFGPQPNHFIVVMGTSKKGRVYDPPSALETATKRMNEVKSNWSRCHVLDLSEDQATSPQT